MENDVLYPLRKALENNFENNKYRINEIYSLAVKEALGEHEGLEQDKIDETILDIGKEYCIKFDLVDDLLKIALSSEWKTFENCSLIYMFNEGFFSLNVLNKTE